MADQPHTPRASLCDVFDLDERYRALSKAGDPLERLTAVIDFEIVPKGRARSVKGLTSTRR